MKISIIVPVYNVEKELTKCVNSLLNQTYKNIQIILVNDGSTDRSGKICEEFYAKDHRIKYICKENGGLSDARNTGLKYVEGDYVIFVDSDDYIEKNTCEKLYLLLNKVENLDVITMNAIKVHSEGQTHIRHTSFAENIPVTGIEYMYNEFNKNSMLMAAWLNVYNVEFLKKNSLFFKKGILHEDEEFTPRVFLKAKRVMHLNYDVYYYIIRDNSITQRKDLSKNAEHLFETLHFLELEYDRIQESNIKEVFKDSLCSKYLYMVFKLHKTKSTYNKPYDISFLKRNSFSRINKFKVAIFSFNKTIYYILASLKEKISN